LFNGSFRLGEASAVAKQVPIPWQILLALLLGAFFSAFVIWLLLKIRKWVRKRRIKKYLGERLRKSKRKAKK
jgi:O-antigen/teichoic acid export membrane protein